MKRICPGIQGIGEPGLVTSGPYANSSLPRLAYIGDVRVQRGFAGAQLLFSLLRNFPANKLILLESSPSAADDAQRLPNVQHVALPYPLAWAGSLPVLRSRGRQFVIAGSWLSAAAHARSLPRALEAFRPEALLSVAHGYSWLAAHSLSRRLNLPLHLLIHDDWRSAIPSPTGFQWLIRQVFSEAFTGAATRLCVSPYMASAYADEFGAPTTVLLPSRSDDCTSRATWGASRAQRPFTIAYTGSLHTTSYASLVRRVANALAPLGGEILVHTPHGSALGGFGCQHPGMRVVPPLPASEYLKTLGREADALFVPMSFAPEHRRNMELSFPSKVADYTSLGLPILIWGPPYSSAVRWATENPGAAACVDQDSDVVLQAVISRLAGDARLREAIGKRAQAVGDAMFSASGSRAVLRRALIRTQASEISRA